MNLDTLKNLPGKVWGAILALLALLFLFWKEKQVIDLKAEAEVSEEKKNDIQLADRQEVVKTKIQETIEKGEEDKKEQLTPDELAKQTSGI